MTKQKLLKLFVLIEIMTGIIFLTLAVIFYISRNQLAGDMTIPLIFGIIGACALTAVPIIITLANRDGIK